MAEPGISVPALPVLGAVTDTSSFVGAKTGVGRFLGAAVKAYVTAGLVKNIKELGVTGDGVTDDTAAINAAEAAMAAAGGGVLTFPAGVFIVTSLTKRSNVIWQGAGIGGTIIRLKPAATVDAIICGLDAYSLFGTLSLGGIYAFSLKDMRVDGNKAAGSACAAGVAIYGGTYDIENLEVCNCSGMGFRTEAGTPGVVPHGYLAAANLSKMLSHDNDGDGVHFSGPSDSTLHSVISYRNLGNNIHATGPTGSGLKLTDCHVWGSTFDNRQSPVGMYFGTDGNMIVNCTAEGALAHQVQLTGTSNVIVGGRYYYKSQIPNSVYGITIGTGGLASSGNMIFTRVDDCQGGAVYFANDGGLNTVTVNGYNTSSGSFGFSGAPATSSTISIDVRATGSITNPQLFRVPHDLAAFNGTVVGGGVQITPFPQPGVQVAETLHATSKRARLALGSGWSLIQDINGNGTRDFCLKNELTGVVAMLFSPPGNITVPQLSSGAFSVGPADSGGTGFRALRVPN